MPLLGSSPDRGIALWPAHLASVEPRLRQSFLTKGRTITPILVCPIRQAAVDRLAGHANTPVAVVSQPAGEVDRLIGPVRSPGGKVRSLSDPVRSPGGQVDREMA